MKTMYLAIFLCCSLCGCNKENGCGQTKKIENISTTEAIFYRDRSSLPQYTTEGNFVMYDSKKKDAIFLILEGSIVVSMQICNFPSDAKKWSDSIPVLISGTKYESSIDHGMQPAINIYYDFVIKELKKK